LSGLNGIHHLTTLTADMDRLVSFYDRVFGAKTTLDMTEDGLRHAFIELGPNTVLHPFEAPFIEVPQGPIDMFSRGRMDHFGLNAESEEAFWRLREKVVEEGAGVDDAVVTDLGGMLSFTFEDPDGARHEVLWALPEGGEVRERKDWTTVEPPGS
jgi:catechol 2,3-dioxygenase-like lactoylglutathione lyase family enzyme